MEHTCCQMFQKTVDSNLIRHRSILDITSKFQEATTRVNRAVAKSVTSCGCVSINASKQDIPQNLSSYESVREHMASHLDGELCETCKDIIESELGNALFYMTALLNALDINLHDVIEKEQKRLDTLGFYRLT